MTSPSVQECPVCHHAPVSGRFCSECGSPLAGARCSACDAELTAGAKFCQECGTPAGSRAAAAVAAPAAPASGGRSWASMAPWAVGGIALLAVIMLIVGQEAGARSAPQADPSVGAAPFAPFAGGASNAVASCASGPAPDIGGMSAQEQAERLFDRVMQFNQQGRPDCVQAFMPMALGAYKGLPNLDLGAHYDLGRLGEVGGDTVLARAEADTILKKSPTHLLGLVLAAEVAGLRHDPAAERRYYDRFLAAEPAERAKGLPEYVAHASDIAIAEGLARQTPK